MLLFLQKIFFLPYRMLFILVKGSVIVIPWIFKRNKKEHLGAFYQRLCGGLGGTFIKLGQTLAMRQDYLDIQHCEALSSLLDEVKPFPAETGIRMIEKELGKPVSELFSQLDAQPFAAASFSQVYKGVDLSGIPIAVKVKRPNMELIVFADTTLMYCWGWMASFLGIGRKLGIMNLIKEVIGVLKDELDYYREGDYLNIFKDHSRKIDFLVVPEYYTRYSTRNIITMSFLKGMTLKELMTKMRKGEENPKDHAGNPIDPREVGRRIYEITMRSVFEIGFFHADLHPGNLFILEDGKIGMIDFGIVGILTSADRDKNFRYVSELSAGNVENAAKIYSDMLIAHPGANYKGLQRDMMIQLSVWRAATADPNSSFAAKSSGTVLNNSVEFARKHHFHLPKSTLLYYKAVLNLDHINIELDRDYDSLQEAENFIRESRLRHLEKGLTYDQILANNLKMMENMQNLPAAIEAGINAVQAQSAKKVTSGWRRFWVQSFQVFAQMFFGMGLLFPLFKIAIDLSETTLISPISWWITAGVSLSLLILSSTSYALGTLVNAGKESD